MNSTITTILSIVFVLFCSVGYFAPKLIKDEETRYGFNAVWIAFLIGFASCALIFIIFGE